jgi:hypothetical protein
MSLLTQKRVLLAVLESTYGSGVVPIGTNAMLCATLTVVPLKQTLVERTNVKGFMGANPSVVAAEYMTVDVEMEMAVGGSSGGTPLPGATPQWSCLLQACGFQQTATFAGVSANAQGGNTTSIVLADTSSAVDDFYSGLSIALTTESGSARAPDVSTDTLRVKLATTVVELSGSLQSGSTDTDIVLSTSASAADDDYVGYGLIIGGATRTITAYDGTTKTATVDAAYGSAPSSGTAFTIPHLDSYLDGHGISVQHFSGTIVSVSPKVSTVHYVYLPISLAISNRSLWGLYLAITTGGTVDTRRIIAYDVTSRKCSLDKPLSIAPTSASTFKLKEKALVKSFDGTDKVVTLASYLHFPTIAGTLYEISLSRLITNYVGASNRATVTPPFTPALRPKSGMAYYINPNVKYTPVSSGHKSVTLYFYQDGVLHSCVGARGTVSFDFTSGALPKAKFSFTGLVDKYEGGTPSGVDFTGYVEPLAVNYANTKSIIIGGYEDTVMEKISIDTGNKVVHRNLPGSEAVIITDRSPKGNVSIEAVPPDDFDFLGMMRPPVTRTSLLFAHGPVGNQIAFYMPLVELGNPSYADKDGIAMMGMDTKYLPQGTGNNEISIICQ